MGRNDLVLVQENGTGPSIVVTLPSTGLGSPLSPFVFLGTSDSGADSTEPGW